MKPKIREILDRCIAEGIEAGYHRAHKHTDTPSDTAICADIERAIWLEIDTYFEFENLDKGEYS
jgi:hypothetical protein